MTGSDGTPDFVPMPGGNLSLPRKREEYLPVRESDWKRLRSKVDSLQRKRRDWAALAWAAIGVAVGAGFTILTWLPAYAELDSTAQLAFAWVTPALIAGLLTSAVLAIVGFVSAHWLAIDERASAKELASDMDAIYAAIKQG